MGKYCRLLSACLHPGHPRFCLGRGSCVRPGPLLSLPKPNASPRGCRPRPRRFPRPCPPWAAPRGGAGRAAPRARPGAERGRRRALFGPCDGPGPACRAWRREELRLQPPRRGGGEAGAALAALRCAARPRSSLRRGPARPLPWSQR